MGHLRAYRAAVDGKHRGNNPKQTTRSFAGTRRLIFAALALSAASFASSASHAQSGPFTGMAGNWSGGGTVTLDDGSTERIRCRATYAVGAGGTGLNQTLTCASDSYRFNLASNVVAEGGSLQGDMEREHPERQRQPRGPRQQRQFSGRCQRARLYRRHHADDARQQAVRADQVRERIPGREYLAVPQLEPFPLRWNRSGALDSWFDAFS